MLSILHRLTGAALSLSFFIFVGWIILLAGGSHYNNLLDLLFLNPFSETILFLASIAYFYHLCTGIRHLFWDLGLGFEIKTFHITGWLALLTTALLTVLFWINII